jgi:hypothetical protein
MRRQVLLLTTSALILTSGAMAATAQGPMTPQPDQHHPQQTTPGQEGSMGQGSMMGRGMMGGGMMGGGMMMASNHDAHDLRIDGRRRRWDHLITGVSGGSRAHL